MLKQRVITGVILASVFVVGLFMLSPFYFSILIAAMLWQGAWEWTGLMQFHIPYQRVICYLIFIGFFFVTWYLLRNIPDSALLILAAAAFWWLCAFILVMIYPKGVATWNKTLVKGLMGLVILLPTWIALIWLHSSENFGPSYVLFLILLISVADTGAYFSGRRWGKTKLAPNVSPGKTMEGVAGGFVAVALCAGLGAYLFNLSNGNFDVYVAFIILSLVTAAFSVLGDLTESMIKRQAGVKDSGTILPGHGGVLDRIDSATAAAPVFVLGLWGWFGLSMDLSKVG